MNNNPAHIPTQVKDPALVTRRRRQIVDAAVPLFIEKGFHKTTTRQIAAAAGLSIGSLYEYVESKTDVLYLVCEAINGEIETAVAEAAAAAGDGKHALCQAVREYFRGCHRMRDAILLIYRVTQTLPPDRRKIVLENEIRLTGIFMRLLSAAGKNGGGAVPRDAKPLEIAAHDIVVLGHMWSLRRWFLGRYYSIDEYADIQLRFLFGPSDKNPAAGNRFGINAKEGS